MSASTPSSADWLLARTNRARNSPFLRNVLVVMTGTAAAQIIGFALSPIISRLYSPSDFGLFGTFGAVTGVIAAGATLEYTQAIMLPKAREDAMNLFAVSCLVVLAVGGLCLAACLLVPGAVGQLLEADGAWILALLVLATIVTGFNQACQAWCIRSKTFKATSASQVVRSLSSNGGQVGLGFLGAGAPGLVVTSVAADALATVNLAPVVLSGFKELRGSLRWARMKELAIEYRDFPQYSATMNVINALSLGLPVILLTHYYGLAVAGAYAFGVRVVQTPLGFVTRSLRPVLFQRACEMHNEGRGLTSLFMKTTIGMFAGALLPSLALIAFAPSVFAWIFGAEWRVAGEFVRWLTLWLLFMFSNLPSVLFARIIRIQRKMFWFDVCILIARATALVLGGMYLAAGSTVLLFSLVGAVLNVVFIVLVGRAVWSSERRSPAGPVPALP